MRMDYTKGSFSVATRSGGTMSRKTFQELLKVYRTLAGKKGVWLPITWPIFLTAAWLSIDDGEAYADFFVKGEEQALASIEMVAAIKRERDLLQKENDRLKKKPFRSELLTEIEALEKENERLRLEVAWFRNAENS